MPSCWQFLRAKAIPKELFPRTWERAHRDLRIAMAGVVREERAHIAAVREARRRLLAGVRPNDPNPQWDLTVGNKLVEDLRLHYVDKAFDKIARTPGGRARLWYQLRARFKNAQEVSDFQSAVMALVNNPDLYEKVSSELNKLKGLFQTVEEKDKANARTVNPTTTAITLDDLLAGPDQRSEKKALDKSFTSHVKRSYGGFTAWFLPSGLGWYLEQHASIKLVTTMVAIALKSWIVGIDGQMNRDSRQRLWRLEPFLRAARAVSPELVQQADPMLAQIGKTLGTIDDHSVDEDLAKLMRCYDNSMMNNLQSTFNHLRIKEPGLATMCVTTVDNMFAISGVTLVRMRRLFESSKDHLIMLMHAISDLDALVSVADYYKQRQELESFYAVEDGPKPYLKATDTFHASIWLEGQRPHPLQFNLGPGGPRAVLFKDMSQDGARLALLTPMADAVLTMAGLPAPGRGRMSYFNNFVTGIYGGRLRSPERQLYDLKEVLDRLASDKPTMATLEHLIEGQDPDELAASAAALEDFMARNPDAIGVVGTYHSELAGLPVDGLQPFKVGLRDNKYVMEPSEEISEKDLERYMREAGYDEDFISRYISALRMDKRWLLKARSILPVK
jgi:hypothetical protein